MFEDDYSKKTKATHRAGRMLMADWDYILDAPDNSTLYCLTDQHVRALLVVAEYLGWPSRYYSDIGTPINRDDVDALRAGVINALMTDKCTELLTKIQEVKDKVDHLETMLTTLETDLDTSQLAQDVAIAGILSELTGIVEPSIALLAAAVAGIASQTTAILSDVTEIGTDVDNIETVITDPVDGLAEVSEDVDAIELRVNKMQGQVTNITNNTIITLNIALPDQTFSTDSTDQTLTRQYARYNALCEAITSWILIEGWAMIDLLGGTPTDLASVEALLAAYAQNFIYAAQNPTGPPYDATTVTAAMVDSAAVNDVACAMITYLQNLAPTPANFSAALSAYTPPAYPDHRKIIVDTLAIALLNLNGFQVFSAIIGPAFDAALALNPTDYNCPPCGTFPGFCGIPQTWDFTLGQKAPWLINRGQLVYGEGIHGVQIPGDTAYTVDLSIYFATPCVALLGHKIEITHARLPNQVPSFGAQWFYLLAGVPTLYTTSPVNQTAAWPGLDTASLNVPTPPGGVGVYRFRFVGNSGYYALPGVAASQAQAALVTKMRFIT